MIKTVIAFCLLLTLVGCSSATDDYQAAVALAKKRAAYINNNAPYDKVAQYLVMKAEAHEKTVNITVLYGGGSKTAPVQAASYAAQNYCSNNALVTLFNQGISYRLVIIDIRGRQLVEQPINAKYCGSLS